MKNYSFFFFFLILGEKKDHQFAMPISVSVLLYTERCLDVIWMSERRLFLLGRRLYITESWKGRSGEIENVNSYYNIFHNCCHYAKENIHTWDKWERFVSCQVMSKIGYKFGKKETFFRANLGNIPFIYEIVSTYGRKYV